MAGARRTADNNCSAELKLMTYIAKPKFHHPTLPTNRRSDPPRLRRQGLHAVRRLRPRLDLGGDHRGLLGARHRAAPGGQALRHRLLVKTPDYFLGRSHGFNTVHGRMPSVADRRQSRQPGSDLPRRVGRRRFGVDRPRPVRARRAAPREHGLHRREQRDYGLTKGQFSATTDKGSKTKKGLSTPVRVDRSCGHGAGARRQFRRAQRSPATRSNWCR